MSIRKGRLTSNNITAAPINFPVGCVLDYAGTVAPTGWLLCFGQTLNISEYPNLFGAIGNTYGGDGINTFVVPDYRGRVLVGKDDMGGSTAGRMSSAGSGIDGVVLGANGGSQTHTLTTAQLAVHTHVQNSHSHSIQVRLGGSTGSAPLMDGGLTDTHPSNGTTATNQNTGSGSAHQNTQPSIISNKIIKV